MLVCIRLINNQWEHAYEQAFGGLPIWQYNATSCILYRTMWDGLWYDVASGTHLIFDRRSFTVASSLRPELSTFSCLQISYRNDLSLETEAYLYLSVYDSSCFPLPGFKCISALQEGY